MSRSNQCENATWRHRSRLLAGELSHMLVLRRDLAALEIDHDRKLLRRSLLIGGASAVMVLTGLSLVLQPAAAALAALTTWSLTTWTLLMGAGLLVPGLLLLTLNLRKTRAEFLGLRGTLAELQEDLIWLQEWIESPESAAGRGVGGDGRDA